MEKANRIDAAADTSSMLGYPYNQPAQHCDYTMDEQVYMSAKQLKSLWFMVLFASPLPCTQPVASASPQAA
jgi:hypothetical protein